MAEETPEEDEAPKKGSKFPLIIGLVLALAGGGGGFYAVQSGMILGGGKPGEEHAETAEPEPGMPEVAFIPVDPLVVSLGGLSANKHLRFRAQIEVPTQHIEGVTLLMPRVVDVLNSYLRALDVDEISEAAALVRLRSQMLRRVQLVLGNERAKDLLIMEFVVN